MSITDEQIQLIQEANFDPYKDPDKAGLGTIPSSETRSKTIIFRDELLLNKAFPDVYFDNRWNGATARKAINLIFTKDNEKGKLTEIADLLLLTGFNCLTSSVEGKLIFENQHEGWAHPDNDKARITSLIWDDTDNTTREPIKDFATTTGLFDAFAVHEKTSELFYVKLAGAYCFDHLRLMSKEIGNIQDHYTKVEPNETYPKFVRSFMALYPEEVNSYTPPKKVPVLKSSTLSKLKAVYNQKGSRAAILSLRANAILNEDDRTEDHQVINAFGGMTLMEHGLTIYTWILRIAQHYELQPIQVMTGLSGPYMNTMLQRMIKYYYIYKATPAERLYMQSLWNVPNLPHITSKYWQTCRLINDNYLLDIGRSANKTAVALLVYAYAYPFPREKNIVLNGQYKVPDMGLTPDEATQEAAIMSHTLKSYQKDVVRGRFRQVDKSTLLELKSSPNYKALSTGTPSQLPKRYNDDDEIIDEPVLSKGKGPGTSTTPAIVEEEEDDEFIPED